MDLKNIEIKARLHDLRATQEIIANYCPNHESIENQVDTFFKTESGRLKLRETKGKSVLIFYDREDSIEPTKSDIIISTVDDLDALKSILTKSLGIRGIVKKTRTLYLYGQTRIHLDNVEGLGDFIELEVVLEEIQTIEDGNLIASDLMNKLNIQKGELIDVAYIDLIESDL